MATYSPADFESSRFDYMEEVKLHLYAPNGAIMTTVTGRLYAREENVDVSKSKKDGTPGTPRRKTLVWIKEIEGYEVPHEDLPDTTQAKTEGWFPEHDIEKMPENSRTASFSVN